MIICYVFILGYCWFEIYMILLWGYFWFLIYDIVEYQGGMFENNRICNLGDILGWEVMIYLIYIVVSEGIFLW